MNYRKNKIIFTICTFFLIALFSMASFSALKTGRTNHSNAKRVSSNNSGSESDSVKSFVSEKKMMNLPTSYSLTDYTPECTYELSKAATYSFPYSGGKGNNTIITDPTCEWMVTSTVDWITIKSGSSGIGEGKFVFKVMPNVSVESREGNITAMTNTITVSQDGTDYDAEATKVNLPSKIKRGEKIKVSATVSNVGEGIISNSNIKYYVSKNKNKSVEGDTEIGTKNVNDINEEDQSIISFKWKVKSKAGKYYIKAFCDNENTVTEINEDNNIAVSKKITVK
ncbi:MAG: hypothetical protein HZA77_03980 [Candidatus Schekmanbacteria bacterium]|nr:hypothetical protein [Candidatus Schekmanbacteria bacterium]